MLQEDVLSIVVISGEMFNKNACLFSKANEDLEIEPSHNTYHTWSPTGPHTLDLLHCTYISSSVLSSFMKIFLRA